MSGELTPGEIRGVTEDLASAVTTAADMATVATDKPTGHIEFLEGELEARDREIGELKDRITELETDLAAAYGED